jgi:hypothetical protein
MAQRRGWIWLFAGIFLALIAGLLTFRTVNEATHSATLSRLEEMPTIQVLVAAQNIPTRRVIDESMVKLQQIPATLVPAGYLRSTAEVLNKFSDTPLVAGEILLQHRLLSPTDANAPVIYRMNADQVLIAIPEDSGLITYSLNRGIPLVSSDPGSAVARRIEKLAKQIIPEKKIADHAQKGLLGRLTTIMQGGTA